MRADVLQVVAICAHGNAWLRGDRTVKPVELHRKNSTFRGVLDVSFNHGIGNAFARGKSIGGTAGWYQQLRAEGVESFNLSLQTCTIDPKQQSEPPWGIVTDGAVGLELWVPNWKKLFTRLDDPSSWDLNYISRRYTLWKKPNNDRKEATAKLADALQGTLELCRDRKLKELCEALEQSIDLLANNFRMALPTLDLYPPTVRNEAKILYTVAYRSVMILGSSPWAEAVLGGPADDSEFSCVRDKLWGCTMASFEAVVSE